jgi:signal transduction histidine kinase
MVFTAVEQRRVQYSTLTANDTVVSVSINYLSAIKNILQLLPDTKNVAVVVGTSPIEKFWLEEIGKEVKPLANRIAFTWYNDLSFEDILNRAAALPPHSAIFWELMIVDAAGVIHEGSTPLTRLHAVANAPIFSYDESFFGGVIVGGPLHSVLEGSRQTAAVAIRILGGEKAGDIKIQPIEFATPKFDWREMQRWGISESRLPPGSEIHFREPTAWERYRWQLTGVIIALLIQAALIAWLLIERHGRRTAQLLSRDRLLEVMHLNRSAAAGAMSASFAHELSQPLGAIMSNAEAAELLLGANPLDIGQVKEILADIRRDDQRAEEIIQHMRNLLKRKSVHDLQELDLNEVIADVMHILSPEAKKRNVSLSTNGTQQPLPVRTDPVHLQQLILNLGMNGMDAMSDVALDGRRMIIQTAMAGEAQVEVSVSDAGTGIPNHKLSDIFEAFYTTKRHGTGLGLSIARNIVETYGGKIWAENRAGGGAVFRFTLPLARVA